MDNQALKRKAELLRKKLITLIYQGGTGHTGGDLSVLNLLTVLYNHTLNVNPSDKGVIDQTELDAYGTCGAHLGGHPDNSIPGVEINTGALGHGLSVGVGMALGAKMDQKNWKTFVVMGDGEQAEGSIYEAAMAANKFHLDNLVAFIDRTGLQISGSTENVMPLESIYDRWTAFGWDVKQINGDDIDSIVAALDAIDWKGGKPHLFISKSTKGLGVGFMENVAKWHHGVPNAAQYEEALHDIDIRIANC